MTPNLKYLGPRLKEVLNLLKDNPTHKVVRLEDLNKPYDAQTHVYDVDNNEELEISDKLFCALVVRHIIVQNGRDQPSMDIYRMFYELNKELCQK